MAKGPDRYLEDPYGAPLSEFTRLRDRLAEQLRKEGRQAEAAHVKRLRKPSAPLWVVNHLARRDPASIARFIDAVDRLKRAPLKGAGEVGQATASQRAALTALLDRTAGLMEAAGLKPSPDTTRRVSDTLLGAAADRHLQSDLRRGRLTAEQKAPGFEVLQGTRLRAVPAAPKGGEYPARQPKPRARAKTRNAGSKRDVRRTRRLSGRLAEPCNSSGSLLGTGARPTRPLPEPRRCAGSFTC